MVRRILLAALCAVCLGSVVNWTAEDAAAQQAFGRRWGHGYRTQDWERFYHYPYVYYPANFYSSEYYRSSDSLYHRYPPEMQIPVYNNMWHNYYPEGRKYHYGNHFSLDVF